MEFIVRYWVATAPVPFDGHKWDDSAWISHSAHPATRLGLRNAILSAEDRLAILRRMDEITPHGCGIFLTEAGKTVILSVHEAAELLGMLERGEFSCESLGEMLAFRSELEEASPREPGRETAPNALAQAEAHPGAAAYFSEQELPANHLLEVDV